MPPPYRLLRCAQGEAIPLDMKIYKYIPCTKIEHLEAILSDDKFYFSDWRNLNDPMEGFFRFWEKDHTDEEINLFVNQKDELGISCFSLTCNEILMWSHYTNNHKGVCIEVDVDINRSQDITLEVIKYQKNIPNLRLTTGENMTPKEVLSTKIEPWCYEKEIRAFCKEKNTRHKVGKITKIIRGIQTEHNTINLIKNLRNRIPVIEAKIDFDTNQIIV